jgi:diguanylate cyclase (GGDEF)-like protein
MHDVEVQEVLDKIAMFDKLYDSVRVVDPFKKEILLGKAEIAKTPCYEVWGRNETCENCISIRAIHTNKTLYKLEYTDTHIYLITAIPVKLKDRSVVVETMKDVTDSMLMEIENKQMVKQMRDLIDHMNHLIVKDGLTEVYNKRFLYERLPIDMIHSSLNNESLSLIMADIDFFKQVNDTYGHLAGDEVLKQFAIIVDQHLNRKSDWVARLGGEEFIICLPGAPVEKVFETANKICEYVNNHEFKYNDKTIHITVSMGVATMTRGMQVDELIDKADKGLYIAKEKGRNRVEFIK